MPEIEIRCADCQVLNRLPEERLTDRPICGRCRTRLPDRPPDLPLRRQVHPSAPEEVNEEPSEPPPAGPEFQPHLALLRGYSVTELVPIPRDGLKIGRSQDADVAYRDRSVSRAHARVEWVDLDSCQLSDTDSTQGTYVNNTEVTRCLLGHGDLISLGCHASLIYLSHPDQDFLEARVEEVKPALTSVCDEDTNSGARERLIHMAPTLAEADQRYAYVTRLVDVINRSLLQTRELLRQALQELEVRHMARGTRLVEQAMTSLGGIEPIVPPGWRQKLAEDQIA